VLPLRSMAGGRELTPILLKFIESAETRFPVALGNADSDPTTLEPFCIRAILVSFRRSVWHTLVAITAIF
jgi:hypothetical protein